MKEEIKHKKNSSKEEEPKWYHYVIVLLVIGIIIGGFYGVYHLFFSKYCFYGEIKENQYKFEYSDNFNFCFKNNPKLLEEYEPNIELTLKDLLNTKNFTFDGSNNGEGSFLSFIQIKILLNWRYGFNVELSNSSQNMTCENSSMENKFISTISNASKDEILFNKENGCITFKAKEEIDLNKLTEKLIVEFSKD